MSNVTFLVTKAFVEGYTRSDGTFVRPHSDRRPMAQPDLFPRKETGGDQAIAMPYASGMSRKRDMAAAIESTAGVGTVIDEISRPGMEVVADAIAAGKPFFVDSGAFQAFKAAMRERKPEKAMRDFDKVFARYDDLSRLVCERAPSRIERGLLMMVAPDVIGDQTATLKLLEKHADQVNAWIERGHEVIIPFQRGALSQSQVFKRVGQILGHHMFVVGIPTAAAAMSNEELHELLSQPYKPERLHILGGVSSEGFHSRMAVIRGAYGDDVPGVTADANVMRSRLHELHGISGQPKFEAIQRILNRVVPDIWGGDVHTGMAKSFEVQRILLPSQPTEAQLRSGQYRKRKVLWRGLVLRIENEAGSFRRGRKPDGSEWETLMHFAYGEVERTEGVDGDPVDVFLGAHMDTAPMVYVVHQRKVGRWDEYDEDKCMLGFESEADATAAFLASYNDPRFLGPVTAMPVEEFIAKVKATRAAPAMIKAFVLRKAHVSAYTTKDGTVVAAHEDRRPAAVHQAPKARPAAREPDNAHANEKAERATTSAAGAGLVEVDGKQRPTTNADGRPIHPDPEGVKNFWRWFGDSPFIDGEGRPMVMWHGSEHDVGEEQFAIRDGKNTGRRVWGNGIYFSQSRTFAEQYANAWSYSPTAKPHMKPCYLAPQRVLRVHMDKMEDPKIKGWMRDEYVHEALGRLGLPNAQMPRDDDDDDGETEYKQQKELTEALRARGYDGLILKRSGEDWSDGVVFDTHGIKSALGNSGAFDPRENSLIKAVTPRLILSKAFVEGHERRLSDGRVVYVQPYSDRRLKHQAVLFAEAPKVKRPDPEKIVFVKPSAAPVAQFDLFAPLESKPAAPAKAEAPDLNSYDKIIVAFSGGKDSIAALLTLIDAGVPREKLELHHHDIDGDGRTFMDWPITKAYCKAVAKALGIPIYFSWREGGFEREMKRQDERTAAVMFETPEGIVGRAGGEHGPLGTRRKFPQVSADLSTRWCSGKLKIDVMDTAIRNQERFKGIRTLVVTGERAEESSNRAKYKTFEPHRAASGKRHIDQYRPVHAWKEQDVWDIMRKHGVVAHPAYQLGWGRLSCRTCIFGSANQWSTIRELYPDHFQPIADYEKDFGVTIHRTQGVHERADKGTPYEAAMAQPDLAAIANGHEWHGDVLVPPDQWKLPAGAFGEKDGPC